MRAPSTKVARGIDYGYTLGFSGYLGVVVLVEEKAKAWNAEGATGAKFRKVVGVGVRRWWGLWDWF